MEATTQEQGPEFIAKHVSIIMLKPENVEKAAIFPHIMRNYGLASEAYEKVLDEEDVRKLYPDMDDWDEKIRNATIDRFRDKKVIALLLSADDSGMPHSSIIDEVARLKGDKTDPLKCGPDTLRYVFRGSKHTMTDEHGHTITYFGNGIHCPRSPHELMLNLEAFGLTNRALELARQKS